MQRNRQIMCYFACYHIKQRPQQSGRIRSKKEHFWGFCCRLNKKEKPPLFAYDDGILQQGKLALFYTTSGYYQIRKALLIQYKKVFSIIYPSHLHLKPPITQPNKKAYKGFCSAPRHQNCNS